MEEFEVERSTLDFEVRAPVIRGRLDALVGRTVFEAKRNLDREMDDVLRKMPDYLADREREFGEPFVGVVSDGLKWVVFELVDGQLLTLKETTLDPAKGEAFLAWLDGVLSSSPPCSLTLSPFAPSLAATASPMRAFTRNWPSCGSASAPNPPKP